jgi:predicted acylesterase/phospholipase RssA
MEPNKPRIGLALSGGGFRATLFHLGVLRLLYDAGLLLSVKRVGSVSGGSIIAAHLVLNWERYLGPKADFELAADEVIKFVRSDVRGRVIRRWLLTLLTIIPRLRKRKHWTFTNLLERVYGDLFKNKTLGDLKRRPDQPQVFFNCASLSTGSICSFGRSGFMWYENDKEEFVECSQTPVAFACAASSAFPPLFPPIEVSHETLDCSQTRFPNPFYLTDGGVYDNLGIDRLLWFHKQAKDIDFFIVSNAEGSFDSEFGRRYTSFISRNVRASNLLMTRVSAQTLKDLAGHVPPVVSIPIRGETRDVLDPTRLTAAIQRSLCNVRTDLDEFSPKEIAALIAHGYAKAREQLISQNVLTEDAPRLSWDPFGNLATLQDSSLNTSELQKSNKELRRSSERKWRLWSRSDLASLALVLVLALYAVVPIWLIVGLYLNAESANNLAVQRARQQIAAEAAQREAAKKLSQALDELTRINRRPPEISVKGWKLERLGFDCPGKDIPPATAGSTPDAARCENASQTAVCWDGTEFKNPSQFGGAPWCTYKAITADSCVGGRSPGRLYRCIPGS